MDKLNDVRQRKVRELIRDEFNGIQVAFADRIGRPDNYVSRVVSSGPNRKGIGERMARHIETRCGKPRGWLDGDAKNEVRDSGMTLYGLPISAEAVDLGREWDKLHEPLRSQVSQLIAMMVAAQVRSDRRPPKPDRPQPRA